MSPSGARAAGWAALIAVALTLAYWLGSTVPIPRASPDGDRLGPESGQVVAEYLADARASLAAAPAGEHRWALVSPVEPWSTDEVWGRLGTLDRVGRVLVRVPIPGVSTPTATVSPGQSAEGVRAVDELAALAMPTLVGPGPRGEAVGRVTAVRLRAGTRAVVGVVVRGTGDALRVVAGAPGVRAVQVMPDGSARFALAPLLPSFTDRAVPAPDDAPVPAA